MDQTVLQFCAGMLIQQLLITTEAISNQSLKFIIWSYDFSYGIEISFLQITVGSKLNLSVSRCRHTQNVIGLAYRYILRFSVFTLS